MLHLRTAAVLALGALCLPWLTGCADSVSAPAELSMSTLEGDTYFVAQPRAPNAVMDALFQGRVVKDGEGCLRLQPPANHTVVWPYLSTLEVREDGGWVVSGDGHDVGRIGGAFRFGGGEVPFLHGGIGFTDSQIEEIQARCPGRFWIVGEVYAP